MNENGYFRILTAYLLSTGIAAIWFSSASIVSKGHITTLLRNVCPISYDQVYPDGELKEVSENCSMLVDRLDVVLSSTSMLETVTLLYGLISIIGFIFIRYFRSRATTNPRRQV